jgi:hypothetical protein
MRPVITSGKSYPPEEIERLHSIKRRGVLLETEDRDRITGETPTLHHYT